MKTQPEGMTQCEFYCPHAVEQFNSEVRLLHYVAVKLTEQGRYYEIAHHRKNIKYEV
jgi:hypothetical protein